MIRVPAGMTPVPFVSHFFDGARGSFFPAIMYNPPHHPKCMKYISLLKTPYGVPPPNPLELALVDPLELAMVDV